MSIINKGTSFSNGEQLTAEKINNLVDDATFDQSATDSASTTVNSVGQIIVADGGITPSKLSAGAPNWGDQGLTIAGDGTAGGLEINYSVSGIGAAFIDFHSRSASNPDYDARILVMMQVLRLLIRMELIRYLRRELMKQPEFGLVTIWGLLVISQTPTTQAVQLSMVGRKATEQGWHYIVVLTLQPLIKRTMMQLSIILGRKMALS